MKKMTRAAGRRRLNEIRGKAFKLLEADFISMKDYDAIHRIIKLRRGQLK